MKFDTSSMFDHEAHARLAVSVVHVPSSSVVFEGLYQSNRAGDGVGWGIFGSVRELAAFANQTMNATIDKALDDPALRSAIAHGIELQDVSIADRLRTLDVLLHDGLISEEEYESARKSILDEL